MGLLQLAIGPWQLLLMLPGLFMIVSTMVIVFGKRDQHQIDHHIVFIVGIYLLALVPLGIIMSLYITNRRLTLASVRAFKYSKRMRDHGDIMLVLSIFCTLILLATNN